MCCCCCSTFHWHGYAYYEASAAPECTPHSHAMTRPWLIIEFQETIGGIYLLLQTSSSIHPNNIVIRLRRTWTTHTSKLYGHIPYCEWKSFLGFLSVEFGGCLLCLNRSKGVPNKPITTTLISCQL